MHEEWRTGAATEADMVGLGEKLAHALAKGSVMYLTGDLGAGKTTFTRGFLRGLGYLGNVKSPTYTLVEPYELERGSLYHFDLYRLRDTEELELLGIRDYFTPESIVMVEWPDRGAGLLPPADLSLAIAWQAQGRSLHFTAASPAGQHALHLLAS